MWVSVSQGPPKRNLWVPVFAKGSQLPLRLTLWPNVVTLPRLQSGFCVAPLTGG